MGGGPAAPIPVPTPPPAGRRLGALGHTLERKIGDGVGRRYRAATRLARQTAIQGAAASVPGRSPRAVREGGPAHQRISRPTCASRLRRSADGRFLAMETRRLRPAGLVEGDGRSSPAESCPPARAEALAEAPGRLSPAREAGQHRRMSPPPPRPRQGRRLRLGAKLGASDPPSDLRRNPSARLPPATCSTRDRRTPPHVSPGARLRQASAGRGQPVPRDLAIEPSRGRGRADMRPAPASRSGPSCRESKRRCSSFGA